MASPKDGSPGTIVPPAAPDVAKDADDADPGVVEQLKQQQRQTGQGKYGQQGVTPFTPDSGDAASDDPSQEKKKSWISIKLVDEDNHPVPGEPYEVTLPDGRVSSGTLDDKGEAKVDGFDPGKCKVSFPAMDKSVWKPK
ncbi:MAG TPA: hypothetical protein VGN88_08430 [Phycisphaerae bacterium]|jgi:hypothetical protein